MGKNIKKDAGLTAPVRFGLLEITPPGVGRLVITAARRFLPAGVLESMLMGKVRQGSLVLVKPPHHPDQPSLPGVELHDSIPMALDLDEIRATRGQTSFVVRFGVASCNVAMMLELVGQQGRLVIDAIEEAPKPSEEAKEPVNAE